MDFAASKSLAIPANSRYIFYQNIRGGGSLLVGLTGLEHCPGELLESSFDFYQTCLEARMYFGESVSGWLAKRPIDGRSCIGCLIHQCEILTFQR